MAKSAKSGSKEKIILSAPNTTTIVEQSPAQGGVIKSLKNLPKTKHPGVMVKDPQYQTANQIEGAKIAERLLKRVGKKEKKTYEG
jgi:hypothetical protein